MVPKRALDEVLILYKSNKLYSIYSHSKHLIYLQSFVPGVVSHRLPKDNTVEVSCNSLLIHSCPSLLRRMIIGCPKYRRCLLVSYSCLSWRKHYWQVALVLLLLTMPLFWSMLLTFQYIPLCSFL